MAELTTPPLCEGIFGWLRRPCHSSARSALESTRKRRRAHSQHSPLRILGPSEKRALGIVAHLVHCTVRKYDPKLRRKDSVAAARRLFLVPAVVHASSPLYQAYWSRNCVGPRVLGFSGSREALARWLKLRPAWESSFDRGDR
eukprot:scaffold8580_cov286-Pinguiococcus_pyrenoidosus.AAC.2